MNLPEPAAAGPADRRQAVPIICLKQKLAYRNRFIRVFDDEVRFADAREGTCVRIVQSGDLPGVVIMPLAGNLVGLVRVYRYPAGAWEWGFPRGLAHGDDPRVTASAELLEELGRRPSHLAELGRMTPDSGILSSVVWMFAAGYEEAPGTPLDTGEVSAITWIPVPELLARISRGAITDGFTLAAACSALCRGIITCGERAAMNGSGHAAADR